MKARTMVQAGMMSLLLAGSSMVGAESLFSEDVYRPLAADQKAYRVGDVVTVLIMELSKAESSADARARQALEASATLQETNDSESGGAELALGRNSASATQREGELRARMSATVLAIDENGRLYVEGKQLIKVNGEEQTIAVAGWVRPEDISVQNTILSTRLSDAQIEYSGDGEVGDPNDRGYIYWFLTKIGLI